MDANVRDAREDDKAPLMSFIRHVWGGHDYIPRVWDEWFRDREGRMFVVEAGGTPVGMNRVRFLQDGSAWFMGARVHPGYRRLGLATLLGEHSMKVAARRGVSTFRLTVESRNYASRRQTATMHFKETARFSVYEPPKGFRSTEEEVARPGRSSAAEMLRLLKRTPEFRLGSGVYWHNYAATALTPEVVSRLAEEGAIWRLGGAIAVVKEGRESSDVWEQVCFVGGPVPDSVPLVKSAVGRVRGSRTHWVFLPQGSRIISALRKEGFTRRYSQILLERHAANG